MTATVQRVEVIPLKGVKLLCDDGDLVEINFDMPRQEIRQKIKDKVGVEPEELERFGIEETSDYFDFICTSLGLDYTEEQLLEAIEISGGYADLFSNSFFETSFQEVEEWFLKFDPLIINVTSKQAIYSQKYFLVASEETLLICTQGYWEKISSFAEFTKQKGGDMNA